MEHTEQVTSFLQCITVKPEADQQELQQLAALLNELILHDFNALVQLLYRVDVPEQQVKHLLQQYGETEAGLLLAGLLVARQKEKAELRQQFQNNSNPSNEERW